MWLFALGDCVGSPDRPLGSIVCAVWEVDYVTKYHLCRALQQRGDAG